MKLREFFTRNSFKKLVASTKIKNRYGFKNHDYRKIPDGTTESQLTMINIYTRMLYNKDSKIEYNAKQKTLGISHGVGVETNYIIVYEVYNDSDCVVKFINKDVTNIISISLTMYNYLLRLYLNKQNVDFIKFENEANHKIDESMKKILENFNKK